MHRRKKYYYMYVETHDGTGHFMAHTAAGPNPEELRKTCIETHEERHPYTKAKVFISRQLEERKFSEIVRAIENGTFDPDIHSPLPK